MSVENAFIGSNLLRCEYLHIGGIGMFPYGFLDTHFANRGRQGRMIQMMIDARLGQPFILPALVTFCA